MRRKRVLTLDLVAAYQAMLPMQDIATVAGMSRQGVWKRLKKAGIVRRQKQVTRPCAYCGSTVTHHLSRALKTNQAYCSPDHYFASLENPEYRPWRHGGRLARAIVTQHYPLTRDQVVHHKDGNQRNNDLSNLAVYASQAEHMAMHRGRGIDPVWDGETVIR